MRKIGKVYIAIYPNYYYSKEKYIFCLDPLTKEIYHVSEAKEIDTTEWCGNCKNHDMTCDFYHAVTSLKSKTIPTPRCLAENFRMYICSKCFKIYKSACEHYYDKTKEKQCDYDI